MFFCENIAAVRLSHMRKKHRILLLLSSVVVILFLMLLGRILGFSLLLPPPPGVYAFVLLFFWFCSNSIAYVLITLKTTWKSSAQNLLCNIWTCLTFASFLFLFFSSFSSSGLLKRHPNLMFYSSLKDKSCILYLYDNGGTFWNGKDIIVTLEMTDQPGKETEVCRLKHARDTRIVWKSDTVFSINGTTYSIKGGKAIPGG